MKFHIVIFGCQMNYADSARIRAVLTNCGFSYTENIQEADIVIFDTCSVRQKSEDKITGKLKSIRSNQKVRITGCMIQHTLRTGKVKGERGTAKVGNFLGVLSEKNAKIVGLSVEDINNLSPSSSSLIPINNAFNPLFHILTQKRKNIELMRRIDDTGFLPLMLQKLGYTCSYDQELINEYEKIIPTGINTSMNTHTMTAYIPISTGCNQFCAYCIVPYARGLEKYFSVQQIVAEAKTHLKHGAQEIVLLGQIVNKHPEFVTIIQKILKLKGLKWLRYTSPYPTYYSKQLLALHEKEQKLCPHIHMPLQSGSDTVLKKMFRGYTLKQAKIFIDNIRKLKRDISITTDIIVGFPGETKQDFKQTLQLVKYGKFDMIYIGIYSPRPGTLAAKNYPDDIPYSEKHKRRSQLNELLKKTSYQNNTKEIGNIRTILINEIPTKKNNKQKKLIGNHQGKSSEIILGYTDNMKQIVLKNPKHIDCKPGDIIQAHITQAHPFLLGGEIIH